MTSDFSGHTVLVTGGAGDLGVAISRAFAVAGAKVALADIDEERAHRAAAAIGNGCIGIGIDVADPRSVDNAVREIVRESDAPDILVNNAGVCTTESFDDITLDSWNRVIAVNLTGAFLCTKATLNGMISRGGGAVTNIGSLAGRSGGILVSSAYSASKAGLAGFTRAAARQLAAHGIRVNCIAPGTLETEMTRAWKPVDLERIRGSVPLGRLGSAEDVVSAVLFLSSDGAGYISGATLDVNGGIYMAP